MIVNYIKLRDGASAPSRGSEYAAGYDLRACLEAPITIQPHETYKVPTGLAIQPPSGYFGAIFARSGLATKQGLRPANCVGVCDEDYRGEYIVALHNDSNQAWQINPDDRIAQLLFLPYQNITFNEVEALSTTTRNDGGFGSTGQ